MANTDITAQQLKGVAPNALTNYVDALVNSADVLNRNGITSPIRLCHFMAQILEECGGLTEREEDLNYSAQRMGEVWPSRFPTVEFAEPYAHNPKALGDKVYNGRMGNATGSDDGYNFRGRGILQITGRELYEKIGNELGIPLTQNPDLAFSRDQCVAVAAAEWFQKGCNALADADNLKAVTLAINGGLIGYNARLEWLRKAKAIWMKPALSSRSLVSGSPMSRHTLAELIAARPAATSAEERAEFVRSAEARV